VFVEKWATGQYNLKKTHILPLSHHRHLNFSKKTKNPLAPNKIPTQQFENPSAPVFEEVPDHILQELVGIDNHNRHQHHNLAKD
jgi:hypothetical protein